MSNAVTYGVNDIVEVTDPTGRTWPAQVKHLRQWEGHIFVFVISLDGHFGMSVDASSPEIRKLVSAHE